ncbi:aminotransferase [Temperatibacter marinus]|uniref:Aminotransferase n=1 Tax=Temperatibacter marinus TaxID=1456591 RepID=A0AA52EGK7_9PROT|nr:aminotransferase [Temperatibacter marinus]WND02748.1 aminotransferase [Temperatibacter marinus]
MTEKTWNVSLTEIQKLQALDRQAHLHSFTDPQAMVQAPPFLMQKAAGSQVMGQGIQLLDAMAGLGNVNIGYGRAEMAEVAYGVMRDLSYYHTFAGITNPWAARLTELLMEIVPSQFNKVFYANSGSEAVETAIKMARLYWKREGREDKHLIISRDFAYHGSTIASSALNGLRVMHEDFGTETSEDALHVEAPFWYRFGGEMEFEEFGRYAAKCLEEKIIEVGADNIAAFIGEPVQATLGCIIPPKSYWPEIERICRDHDILLIADEVVTGLGRTGEWFGQETFNFSADIMTLAKGLSSGYQAISATLFNDRVASVIEGEQGVLQHGFTTSAHPVACAVAAQNIKILQKEKLIERIRDDIGPYFKTKLEELLDIPIIGEVRTCGLMAGIELCQDKETRDQYPLEYYLCQHIAQAALETGVIVRPAGNVIVTCPPFIFTHEDVDALVRRLRRAIEFVHDRLKAEGLA